MKILVGTTSEQKIEIVKNILKSKNIDAEIIPVEVNSDIVEQPLDEETTIQGSINRALNAIEQNKEANYDFSIGLEGGLVSINDNFNLVCAVSIINKNRNIFTGISRKIPLPQKVSERVQNGEQFGIVIREFEREVSGQDNATQDLVKELINRTKSFSEASEKALMKYENKK